MLFETCGIISVTDSENDNPTLWANYADKHRGFSVTYNRDFLNNIAMGPFRIDYLKNFEKVMYNQQNINALILFLSTVKSMTWSYEKEWRFIGIGRHPMYIPFKDTGENKTIGQQNRKLYLRKNSINGIKLGFSFFDDNNIYKNNLNEYIVNLNAERDKEIKIKLLTYVNRNNIPLSLTCIDNSDFKFKSCTMDYELIPELNLFKYSLVI
jgi:hypothetical protein